MMEYQQTITEVLQPKKSFNIKKTKRIINIRTDPPLAMITNSQPVTPSRPTICTEIKSQRNTIDYFIQFTEKNKQVLEQKQMFLPSLNPQTDCPKLIKQIRPSYSKKRSLQKQMFNHEDINNLDLKLNLWKRNRVGTSSGTQRIRVESKIREKAVTIDVDKPMNKMKPMIIHNKFLGGFPDVKKPSSYQMRYFRNKIKPSRTQQCAEALFTFYPKQEYCRTEAVNEFLDIN